MNEVIRDVEVLKNAIIAFTEGASDEKRMAINSLSRLVEEKETLMEEYDNYIDMLAEQDEVRRSMNV